MTSKNQPCLVVYLPVLHRGYIELFRRHTDLGLLLIVGEALLAEVGYKEKEIRALSSTIARDLAGSLGLFQEVDILTSQVAQELTSVRVVAASDEVTRAICAKYWEEGLVEWDTAFQRWDTNKVFSQNSTTLEVRTNVPLHQAFMLNAATEAQHTSDWWRQVGAVAVRDGKVIMTAYNRHLPSEHTPYAVGDPRDFVKAGERSELASAIHAEQQIIAAAARDGVSLNGAALYVTVFPCPVCAKLIACSGISKVYYGSGHASLDGESVLKAFGVQLVQVV